MITPEQRKAMIERLAEDFVDAEMDGSARESLYEFMVNGCKGLNDYTDEELLSEYREAYGDDPE